MRVVLVLCLILSWGIAAVDEMGNELIRNDECGVRNGELRHSEFRIPNSALPWSGPNFPELIWEARQSMPTARFGMAVAATNDLLYAVGGYAGSRVTTNEVYDPAGDTWATRTPMANARNGCYGASLDGWIYVVGGYNGSVRLNIVEGYDVTGDSWYTLPLMSLQRTVPAAVGLGGKLYVFGGFDGTNYHRTVERYDPGTNTWDTVAPMPTGRSGLAACALDGKIYVMGGWTGAEPTHTELEMYDPAGDSWATLPPMPTGRMYLTASGLSGYVLAIGGQLTFSGPQTDIVEVYDPTAGDWSTANPMLVARGSLGAATSGEETYAVGGYTGSGALAENDGAKIQTGINENPRSKIQNPKSLDLSATPNPASSGHVRLSCVLPSDARVVLRVLDLRGRAVRILQVPSDSHVVDWDRCDDAGRVLPAGVYFCRLEAQGFSTSRKLVLTR